MPVEATIIEIHEETPTVKSFLLDLGGAAFQFFPGQWVDFYIETASGLQIGGFSITSSPTVEGTIELAVKRLPYGIPAQYLHDKARIGDSFHIDTVKAVAGDIGQVGSTEVGANQIGFSNVGTGEIRA